VPSVNVIQSIEPRLPPPPSAPDRGGEPFAELLDSAVAAHHEPAPRDPGSKRPDAAPSRANARAESLARNETPERAEPSGPQAETETSADLAEKPDAAPGEQTVSAEPVVEVEADPKPDAVVEAKPCESKECPELVSASLEDAADSDAGAETTDGDAPAVKTQGEPVVATTTVAKAEVVATVATQAAAESIAPDVAAVEAEIAAPVAATNTEKEAKPTQTPPTNGLKQALDIAAAASTQPAEDRQDVSEGIPAPQAPAKAAQDQTVTPQLNASTAPAPADDAVKPAANSTPQTSQADLQVQSFEPKPAKTAAPTTADNPAPAPSTPDAPKIHTNASTPMPEPVRAVASSLNAASLHSANAGQPNAVPLKGVELAVEIVSRMREGTRRFDIRLDPPELGRIEVRLEVDRHGHATTRLTVDRPETLDLLQREARGLERALQQAGLKTDQGGLEFSLRQQTNDGTAYDQSGRSQRQAELVANDDSEMIDAVVESYRATARARGGVDIKV
jgi:flagellar hook-length control protein FliK